MPASKEEFVTVRVDARKKRKAARILRERGLNLSSFIRSMLYVVAETGRVPFPQPPYEPNAETAAAIRDAHRGAGLSKSYDSVAELLNDLDD